MTDAQREALDPSSHEYMLRVNGSKTQVAGWAVYITLLWTLKAAMCTFYLRLTEGLEYRGRIYAGFVLIFLTWIIVLLSVLLGCRPLHNYWQINPDPGSKLCPPDRWDMANHLQFRQLPTSNLQDQPFCHRRS